MPYPYPKHTVHVLDKRKVPPLNDILLELLAMIEGNFLRRLEQAGMGEA